MIDFSISLRYRPPADATAGEVFTYWQWTLHSGQACGMTGRALVCLTGAVWPLLFATEVIRWLQKRRAHKWKRVPKRPSAVQVGQHG